MRRFASLAFFVILLVCASAFGPQHRRGRGGGHPHNTDTTAPATSTLSYVSTTMTSITLTWTAPGDNANTGRAARYDVRYVAGSSLGAWASATRATGEPYPSHAGTTEVFTVTRLAPGTTYTFAMKTADEVPNTSGQSNSVTHATASVPDNIPPVAIADLAVGNPTQTTMQLTWTAPGDDGSTGTATAYEVRYSTAPITLGNFPVSTLVAQTMTPQVAASAETLAVSGLTASTLYYFAVKTSDDLGNMSGLSNVVSDTTAAVPQIVDQTAPAAVENLSVAVNGSTGVLLAWVTTGDDGNTGLATSYDLRRSTANITSGNFAVATQITGEPAPSIAGTTDSYYVTGLSTGTVYYFAIKVIDDVGNTSAISNIATVTTQSSADVTAPTAVSDLALGTLTANSITATWTAPGDDAESGTAVSYNLRYSTAAITSGNFSSATSVSLMPAPDTAGTVQTKRVPNLAPSTLYYFALKTTDEASNTSAISNVPSASTTAVADVAAPDPVSTLSIASLTPTSVTLAWTATGDDASTGTASTYDLRYSTSLITAFNFAAATAATGESFPLAAGSAESYTVTGLSTGVLYYFALVVYDEAANSSGLSNVPSATTSQPVDVVAPAVVANLYVQSVTSTSAVLTWTAPGDDGAVGLASTYDIRSGASSATVSGWTAAFRAAGEPTPFAAGATQTFTFSDLSPSSTFYVGLKSQDEVPNTSGLSNIILVETLPENVAPAAITDLVATASTSNSITLSWTEVGNDSLTGTASSHTILYAQAPTPVTGMVPVVANGGTWSPSNSPYTVGNFTQAVGSGANAYNPAAAAAKLLGQAHPMLHTIAGGSWPVTAGYAECLSAILGACYQHHAVNEAWTIATLATDGAIPLGGFGAPLSPGTIVGNLASRGFEGATVYVNLSTSSNTNNPPFGLLPPSGFYVSWNGSPMSNAYGRFPKYGGIFWGNLTASTIDIIKDWSDIALSESNANGPTDGDTQIATAPRDRIDAIRRAAPWPIQISTQLNGFSIFVSDSTPRVPSAYYPMQVRMFHKANALSAWVMNSAGTAPLEFHLGAQTTNDPWARYFNITNAAFRTWLAADVDSVLEADGLDYLFMDQLESSLASERVIAPSTNWPTDAAWEAAWQDFFARLQTGTSAPTTVAGPVPVAAGQAVAHGVGGLTAHKRYFFAVTTSDEAPNLSGLSNLASDTTTAATVDVTAPSAISTLAVSSPTITGMRLIWTATGDDAGTGTASSYDIRYSTAVINSGNFDAAPAVTQSLAPRASGAADTCLFTQGSPNTLYYFAIKAMDEVFNASAISNVVSETTSTDTTPPSAVGDLAAAGITSSTIQVTWHTPADDWAVQNFDLRYSTTAITSGNFASATQVTGEPSPGVTNTAQTMNVAGLTNGQTYYFAVKSVDQYANTSAISNVVSSFTAVQLTGNMVGDGPYYMTQPGTTYVLQGNVITSGTAIVFAAQNVTLDLNGYTVTYGTGSASYRYGVPAPPPYAHTNPRWSSSDITVWNSCTGAILKNGSIVQGGTGLYNWCFRTTDQNNITLDGVTMSCVGNDSGMIYFEGGGTQTVRNCVLNDNTGTTSISNRHQGRAAIDFESQNGSTPLLIYGNTITGARQWGIRISRPGGAVAGQVYSNTIGLSTIVTNGYGIALQGPNLKAHDNVIVAANGRGILLSSEGANISDGCEVYNNTVTVQELPNHVEYDYLVVHGIKLDYPINADIHDNTVTAIASVPEANNVGAAAALSISLHSNSGCSVHDNTFVAQHAGGAAYDPDNDRHYATCINIVQQYASSDSTGLSITNNTCSTQDQFISVTETAPYTTPQDLGMTISGNTWTRATPPQTTSQKELFVFGSSVANLDILDPLGADNFRTYRATWPYGTNSWATKFTGLVRTVGSGGSVTSGVTVEARNAAGTLVATVVSGATGAVFVLPEFTGATAGGSGTITEKNPYTFTVLFGSGNQTGVKTVDAKDWILTVTEP